MVLPLSSWLPSSLLLCLFLADILDIDDVRWNAFFCGTRGLAFDGVAMCFYGSNSHSGFLAFFLLFFGKFPILDSLVIGITLIIDCNFTLSLLRPIQNLFSTGAHFWPQLQFFH